MLLNVKTLGHFLFCWFILRFYFINYILINFFIYYLIFSAFYFLCNIINFWSAIVFYLQWALLSFNLIILIWFLFLKIFWLYILSNRSHFKLDKSSSFDFPTLLINFLHPLNITLVVLARMPSLLVIVRAVFM